MNIALKSVPKYIIYELGCPTSKSYRKLALRSKTLCHAWAFYEQEITTMKRKLGLARLTTPCYPTESLLFHIADPKVTWNFKKAIQMNVLQHKLGIHTNLENLLKDFRSFTDNTFLLLFPAEK